MVHRVTLKSATATGALAILLGSIIYFIVFPSITGNIALDLQSSFKINDPLQGKLKLTLEPSDSIPADDKVLMYIVKDDSRTEIVSTTFKEIIEKSHNFQTPVEKNGKYFYETPGTYTIDFKEIVDYTFTEPGEFALIFSILDENVHIQKNIIVLDNS